MNWAKRTKEFDFHDQFVASHPNHNIFLQKLHASVRKDINKLVLLKPYKILKKFGNWRDLVVDWYNDWAKNGYFHKKKQLFLYGESNTGKSTFIKYLMGKDLKYIF